MGVKDELVTVAAGATDDVFEVGAIEKVAAVILVMVGEEDIAMTFELCID